MHWVHSLGAPVSRYASSTCILLCSFIQYHSTSLERGHKHDLLTEVDLGVPIDLILPETYSKTEPASEFVCTCTLCYSMFVAVLQPFTNQSA